MLASTDLTFFDFETRGRGLDIKAIGTPAYAAAAEAIVLAFAIGEAPAQVWHAEGAILDWNDAPAELKSRFDDGALLAAWNASFDSAIWNYATLGFPFLEPERVIDPMIQAGVSNLPTDLEGAARYLGCDGKQADGKKLIKLFSVAGAAPADHPEDWLRFLDYAKRDVEAMREVYQRTRPLPLAEWQQYWAFERVNRRGVSIDAPFVERAAALAAEDATAIGRRLRELTDGAVTSVGQAQRIATWLHDQLPDAAMRKALTIGVPADEDEIEGDVAGELEFSLTRDRVARVLARLEAKQANGGLCPDETKAFEVATLRLYGAGASPKKFARIAREQIDGVIRDQYRFAGAGQTGRASGKGIQVQNLVRDTLGDAEAALVDAIADGCTHAEFAAADPSDVSVTRKLALLVRPALIANPGKVFVWGDWSAIEARVTPWLAASPEADQVLDIFRACDADPTLPDIYTLAAADILHKEARTVTEAERAIGKVSVLACGFGGSVGALQAMALNFRIHLDNAEARRIVDAWREANPWAPAFWGAHREGESWGLWGAAMSAWEQPGLITTAGRIGFTYRDDYLGGSLFMALPSGRVLTYPRLKWREVDILDKDGEPTGERRRELSFRRAHGRAKLWRGTLCENSVQGTAAELLRATVTRMEMNPELACMPIRLHTHDEILVEVDEGREEEATAILRREMLTLPDWAAGLPLQSEESVCRYYTKNKSALRGRESAENIATFAIEGGVVLDVAQRRDALDLLRSLSDGCAPLVFFDPQHRAVLDRLKFGNEDSRQRGRAQLPSMSEEYIDACCREIARALAPGGYLMRWMDTFGLCEGHHLRLAKVLKPVDLIAWDSLRMGMGKRSRRRGDYLLVLQKPPINARTWRDHAIPSRWPEKIDKTLHPHVKPAGLISRLIAAVTEPGNLVVDPAAGSFVVMRAARQLGRHFVGGDVLGEERPGATSDAVIGDRKLSRTLKATRQ